MKDFAKTFDTEYGQLLVTNDERDELPSVNFFFRINENFGICEVSCKFSMENADKCDEFFDNITIEQAITMVKETIIAMR